MKSFLNYFALKMILLNIFKNVLYLLKYFIMHIITIIPQNDTFLYNRSFYSIKKCMMVEIIDKNVFKIMTSLNNLLLIYRF